MKLALSALSFTAVGVVGFLVDGGVLQFLVSVLGANPFIARALSLPLAVLSTWALNRHFTFRLGWYDRHSMISSLWRYVAVSLAGATINVVTYYAVLASIDKLRPLPIIALAIASLVAMVFNYVGSKHFAFRRRPDGGS